LKNGIFSDLDRKESDDLIDPNKAFRHSDCWNMDSSKIDYNNNLARAKFEDEYFDNKWIDGALRICNFGCGISLNLVLNGDQRGNIWVDDRCNDGGIYPDQRFGNSTPIPFLDWYEHWIDKSLEEVS